MSRKKKFFPTLGIGLKKTSGGEKDHALSVVDLDIDIMPALNTTKNKKTDGKLGSKVFRAKVMEEKKVRSTSHASRTSSDSFEKIVNIESVGVKSKNSTKM